MSGRRFTPNRYCADLCKRVEHETGLENVAIRDFPEGRFAVGDRDGWHIMFAVQRDGVLVFVEKWYIGDDNGNNYVQGELL